MIIVTLSVVCTLKGMLRWSIQRIKAMLLCIEYGILFVDTVDTKIKVCKALNAIYVNTVDTRQGSLMHSMLSMSTLSIQKHIHTFLPITFLIFNGFSIRKKFWKAETQGFSNIPSILYMSTLSNKTRICNAFNAIYVDTLDTKHIHTFLLITFLIFNGFSIRKKFWKAETQGFSTVPSIL